MEKKRLHLLDEIRGFWLINMMVYHALWDMVYIFGWDLRWYRGESAHIWQQCICWSFILVSGFCWSLGKKKLRRGLEVFGAGLVITLVTLVFMPDSRVIFGVLTLLGSSMLLMLPCDKLFCRINPRLGMLVSLLVFLFIYPINGGYLGFAGQEMIHLPEEWYANLLSTYLGMPEPGFWSTDYFSLLPWFFLYVTGYFAYGALFSPKKSRQIEAVQQWLGRSLCPPLGWLGRNSLLIYMLHQPVIYALLLLIEV